MPEQYRKHYRHPAKPLRSLRDGAEDGQIISIRCNLCQRRTNFMAEDLVKVLDPARPIHAPPFPCSKCSTSQYIDVKVTTPYRKDFGRMVVRRLVGQSLRNIWSDKKLGDPLNLEPFKRD